MSTTIPVVSSDEIISEENDDEETPQKNADPNEIRLRVAVVGGGAAGLSTALHLAPLASKGLISSPIHLYESNLRIDDNSEENYNHGNEPYGRDVGVGIWSSALLPFLKNSNRTSHKAVLQDIQEKGRWVNKVGYRTPDGAWLARSRLANGPSILGEPNMQTDESINNSDDPALLFLKEKDLMEALRKAVKYEEEECSTIHTHYARKVGCKNATVEGVLAHYDKNGDEIGSSLGLGRLVFGNGAMSKGMYHMIIDASGTNSRLRTRYGSDFHHASNDNYNQKPSENSSSTPSSPSIEDRKYFIFRGTSPLSNEETGMNGTSFQTWGEKNSMRFATVPMKQGQAWFVTTSDPRFQQQTEDHSENENHSALSHEERKQLILETFKDWHDPIISLIESTPATDIIMERAIAHQFSMGPVLSLHNATEDAMSQKIRPDISSSELRRIRQNKDEIIGRGPILCFVGDANMTVDPVLAQGFTMGMEDASLLASTVHKSCIEKRNQTLADTKSTSISSSSTESVSENPQYLQNLQNSYNLTSSGLSKMKKYLTFNPRLLRSLLRKHYNELYEPRLLCLLRATQLVQTLAQPSSTSAVSSALSIRVIRPVMRIMPNIVKKPIFDWMMKYSLGTLGKEKERE